MSTLTGPVLAEEAGADGWLPPASPEDAPPHAPVKVITPASRRIQRRCCLITVA
jgi:hypothetical protein